MLRGKMSWRTIWASNVAGSRAGRRLGVVGFAAALAMLALAPTFTASAATTRPISDFLATQGTLCVAHPERCPHYLGTYVAWTDPFSGRIAQVDYAGKEAVAGLLGTTTTGTVTEQPLSDGRAQVRVQLQTRNAMTYVLTWDPLANFDAGAPLFGHTTPQIQRGAAAGVGNSQLDTTFNNSAPGAPLPDLVAFNTGDLNIADLTFIAFQASATGPLRTAFGVSDGT